MAMRVAVIVMMIVAMVVPAGAIVMVMMMVVAVMMIMPAFMSVMMIMPMMVMTMRRDMLRIGAALGIERRLDFLHLRAEATRHVGDNMVAPDTQLAAEYLCGEMAIAEVPCDAHEVLGVARENFEQGFGR